MEHPGVSFLHPNSDDNIAFLTGEDIVHAPVDFINLINELGVASSKAQGLKRVITTYSEVSGSDNHLYIKVSDDGKSAIGFCKVGYRRLFLWDHLGEQHELNLLCLLDFYVCSQIQRRGYGKQLIDRMLKDENIEMKNIPIDSPSRLCLAFMKKHFGFENYIHQNNHYVVFDQFWETLKLPNSNSNLIKGNHNIAMTPPRAQISPIVNSTTLPQVAQTPSKKKQHYNPITWEPID